MHTCFHGQENCDIHIGVVTILVGTHVLTDRLNGGTLTVVISG